jgi:hypothetical protein
MHFLQQNHSTIELEHPDHKFPFQKIWNHSKYSFPNSITGFSSFFLVKQGNEVLILSVNYSTPDITTLLNYPTYTDVVIISKDSNRGKKFHFKLLLLPRSHVQLHIHKNKLLLTW